MIYQLNKYPADRYNVLVPVTTLQAEYCFYRQGQAYCTGEARSGYYRSAWVQANAVHLYELQGGLS